MNFETLELQEVVVLVDEIDERLEMERQTSMQFDEYEEVINEAVESLSLPRIYKSFFLHHVCPDLKEMNYLSQKEKFRRYACILQKQYPCSNEIEEIHIRRMLINVVPKTFLEVVDATEENEKILNITQSDKDIVQYLCGALLKWGMMKLPNEESNWCKTQLSTTNKLSPHFQKMNRGGLVIPNDQFFALILQCETGFRKLRAKRKISTQSIIEHVFQQGISITNPNEKAIKQLLGRYVRMRAHILTKHNEKLNLQKKKQRKGMKKSTQSLRSSLKTS